MNLSCRSNNRYTYKKRSDLQANGCEAGPEIRTMCLLAQKHQGLLATIREKRETVHRVSKRNQSLQHLDFGFPASTTVKDYISNTSYLLEYGRPVKRSHPQHPHGSLYARALSNLAQQSGHDLIVLTGLIIIAHFFPTGQAGSHSLYPAEDVAHFPHDSNLELRS